MWPHHEGTGGLGVDSLRSGDGSGTVGPSVIGALEADDVLPSRRLSRNLNSRLDGLGTRVPEEERVEGFVRHDGEKTLNQLEIRRVEGDGALEVDEVVALLGGCGGHGGVAAGVSGCSGRGTCGMVWA